MKWSCTPMYHSRLRSIYLRIHLSVHPSINPPPLSVRPSIHPFIYSWNLLKGATCTGVYAIKSISKTKHSKMKETPAWNQRRDSRRQLIRMFKEPVYFDRVYNKNNAIHHSIQSYTGRSIHTLTQAPTCPSILPNTN